MHTQLAYSCSDPVVSFNLVLGHPGITRLTGSMREIFYHPYLMQYCKEYICKDNCTTAKNQNRGYSHLGAR